MSPSQALAFKEQGNALFKSSQFQQQASNCDPDNPTYPSNLSAALYELGDYLATVHVILRVFHILAPNGQVADPNIQLARKLSVRLVKALLHGSRNRKIPDDAIGRPEHKIVFNVLERLVSDDVNAVKLWSAWSAVAKEKPDDAFRAKQALLELPIWRKPPLPSMNYFHIGTDELISLVDGWGPDDPHVPLHLDEWKLSQFDHPIGLLLGGVGDGRHILSTLIGAHRAYEKLSSSPGKKDRVKFHLTALDIHPTVIARNLVFLLLLDDLAQGLKNGMGEEERAEIKANFLYTFIGAIMPPYCQTRLMEKVKDARERLLSNPPAMPSWIYVAPGSAPSVVSALDYWLKIIPKKTLKGILEHHEYKSSLDMQDSVLGMAGVSAAFKERVQSSRSRTEQQVATVVDGMSDADLQGHGICPPGLSMSEARKFIKRFMVDEFLDQQGLSGSGGPHIFEKEMDWYKEMNCFYPPRELEKRHRGLVALKKQVMEQEAKGEHPNPDKRVVYVADKEYYETWKPNITLFDPTADEYDSRYVKGYPKLSMDFFSPIKAFRTCYDTFELGKGAPELEPHRISYGYVSRVFEAAAEAVLALSSKPFSSDTDREGDRGRGRITVEVICGELIDELRRMKLHHSTPRSGDLDLHGLSSRPEGFPKSYVRIWLSNIPLGGVALLRLDAFSACIEPGSDRSIGKTWEEWDYTHGLITTAIYVLPVLRTDTGDAAIASNCVLNTGAFRGDDEFIHTYTLLTPTDVPRFLGCRIINTRALADILSVGHPRPGPPLSIKDLATREELIRWLNRQLVNTLSPGKPHQGVVRVRSSNNMVAFVNLLVHLCGLGFPTHWISDYVQNMLADRIVVRVTPARGLPIPVSDVHSSQQGADRKLGLGPWMAELEVVLASVRRGLPFFVSLPSDDGIVVASELEDIGKFEAKVRSFMELRLMQNVFSPFDPVTNLLFWKPTSSGWNEQALKKEGERIIEQEIDGVLLSGGQPSPKWNGKFLVLTAQESVDQEKSVSWRMAKKRVERMRGEGWVMMIVTSDFRVAVTKPVPASEWWEVQDLD